MPPGIVRPARRPAGWVAPGPAPAGASELPDPTLDPQPGEDLCYLLGDWRIFQRVDGHRWSLDDLVTAYVATRGPEPNAALDLGCGIGSVAMMVAWSYPRIRVDGIEAQALSIAMARRSVRFNGCDDRVQLVRGDLRETRPPRSAYQLVTGTPPYFAAGTHVVSDAVQKGPCRHEVRGGVEDYVRAAAACLAADGRFVVCMAHRQTAAAVAALHAERLEISRHVDVVPRSGKAPLITVLEARPASGVAHTPPVEQLTVRDRTGAWTDAFLDVRRAMGLPPAP